MKILTICSAGAVRSVAMAHYLKQVMGHDAVPVGADANSPETITMLSDWADLILPMQPEYARVVPKRNRHKTVVLDIGSDVWMNSLHPDLIKKVSVLADELRKKGLV